MSLCVKATVAAKIAVKEPIKTVKFEAKNELLKKLINIGYGEKDLINLIFYIKELAPLAIHVHVDK